MKGFFREIKRINWGQTFFGSFKRTVISLILVIPILSFAASLGYQFYLQQNPAVVYAHKLQDIKQQVSKSVSLPTDETPTVATVTDKNIVPDQPFFKLAQNGDKILMYRKHKLAILFRPSTGKVITKAILVFKDVTPTPANGAASGEAVAGASTSISSVPGTSTNSAQESSAGAPTTVPESQSSRPNSYTPQGKVLVLPKQ
jgi:hypothetical protein